jgi:hypothetical protein
LEAFVLPAAAFFMLDAGLLTERRCFFARANHPRNLYYQTV